MYNRAASSDHVVHLQHFGRRPDSACSHPITSEVPVAVKTVSKLLFSSMVVFAADRPRF